MLWDFSQISHRHESARAIKDNVNKLKSTDMQKSLLKT
jgi:hypothetical protein